MYIPQYNISYFDYSKRILIKNLKRDLKHANSYLEWQEIALALDQATDLEQWKYQKDSPYYDYHLIDYRINYIKKLLQTKQDLELVEFLREGLSFDIANISHPLLFTHTFTGTKKLIEEYLAVLSQAFKYIASSSFTALSNDEKQLYFKSALQAYGQPVMMFSGGATLGLFHSGVCKVLLEQDLLPKVISGSSAGALMTGIIATRSDDELIDIIQGHGFYEYAFKFKRFFKILLERGGIADIDILQKFLRENIGEYTFSEGYQKSGRHASIVVAPYEAEYSPQIMNEITAPDVLIWSATLASSAVPFIFPPVQLTTKRKDGKYTHYMKDTLWVDGSVRSDFPQEKIARLYNVNYSIASQVNPHIVPFMQNDVQRYRKDLLSWPTRIIRKQSKHMALETIDFLRSRLNYMPMAQKAVDNSYGILGQQYYGDINIVGDFSLRHYSYMLRNPEPKIFHALQKAGERATWAKVSSIETYAKIGKVLQNCLSQIEHASIHHQI